jgi:hypothetical protein
LEVEAVPSRFAARGFAGASRGGRTAEAGRVEGKGLDAKVTMGKQTVRFDGQKLVFGS